MSEPIRACPFWSRVAQVNGIVLALCSAEDLERQRDRGFASPEGWQRRSECYYALGYRFALIRPSVYAFRVGADMGDWTLDLTAKYIGTAPWHEEMLARDFDTVWAKALEWAAQQ